MEHRQKLALYYLITFAPFGLVLWAMFAGSDLYLILLVLYIGFRIWFDRRKLIRKGVIGPEYGYFRFLVHGHIDYFRQLFLEP